ncbi:beta-L-arabinofuranosidase domain-containing protein [Pedobacter petrophilus]|nr:beta-L-arabinofuranosidase domain-containing protein [Pedobacter petrophilus]
MKISYFKTALFFILLFSSGNLFAQLPINGKWAYSFEDDKSSALPSFDDTKWKTKESKDLKWEKTDLPAKGNVIWIRKTVVIPSSLKKELDKTGALVFYLGRIKQEDKTYFNGKLVGETTSGDLKRAYILNDKDIIWDKPNTFAVRITHWGDRSTVDGEIALMAAKPAQIFEIKANAEGVTNKQQVNNKKTVYNAIIKNNVNRKVAANLLTNFYDLNNKKIKTESKNITLKPGDNIFSIPFQSPSKFLKTQYSLSIPVYSYHKIWNAEYGYIDISYKAAQPKLAYKAKETFTPALLGKQTINGWLGQRLNANKEQRLYKVDETALLAGFINKPGAHPWIGEHVGKFLEAACNSYQNNKDPLLKIKIDRTAQQLIASQLNDGYLGTYDTSSQWTSWDVWSHKYDLVGLLSYYELSGYEPALAASQKIGDLLSKRFGDKPGQLDIIKAGAHVGMAATSVIDPMTDLYRFSGKKEYLDFCYYITKSYNGKNGPRIIATLDSIGRVDKTANAKAYEMMSNLVGLVKLYRVTNDEQFLKPVLAAWKDITQKRLYITGTTSSFEHFQDDYLLPASNKDNMGEGCVTTTWLQLNFQLLSIFGKMEYVDELERSVYNHLTGAENPQTGCVSYYTPLMGTKPYRCVITCCMSSVPRGIAMIPLFTNGKINGSPSILFYQPGVYKTVINGNTSVEFTTKTTFPENGDVTIEVNPSVSGKFEVLLRKPYWAADYKLSVNGVSQPVTATETESINRVWKKGDKINVNFSLPVKVLDGGISYPGSIAFQRGPQILVFDKMLNPNLPVEFSVQNNAFEMQQIFDALPAKWVGTQAYQVKVVADGKPTNIILVPYADASQTGGDVTTWIKSNNLK